MPRKAGASAPNTPVATPRFTRPATRRRKTPGPRCECDIRARSVDGMRIYTVGHSNLDFDDFTAMLSAAGVESIVDVRKLPGSRKYPWFNDDHLAAHLPDHGIAYSRSEGLTGRRNVSRTVPFEVNGN